MTPAARHTAIEDTQGIVFGVSMAALGMHILTHMGFVTGQTAGLAIIIAHLTGLPFAGVYFAVTLPFLGLAWRRRGARFAVKTLVTTAALSGLVAALPGWIELGRMDPIIAAVLFGMLFGIAALAVVRHGGSFGGLSVLWVELQDRTGFPAGHAQLLSDLVIFGIAALIVPLDVLGYSFLGAAVFALFLAMNHRRDRYIAA
jgi:uncharacterized membrane-anchored protein YitT (DUF2179 family)